MLLALAPLAGTANAASTTRLSASENVGAALAWSQATFADGTAPTVLLARDDLFADSLASGAAQGAASAPLLLTDGDVVDPRVQVELRRLGAETVVLLGGPVALSAAVVTQLESAGFDTERLRGATRVETAVAISQRFFPTPTRAIIARAFHTDEPTQAFADSLATGAYSAATNKPILFTQTGVLTGATREYLRSTAITEVVVAGGTGAVSDAVVTELRGMGIEVRRISGENRFATAAAMANDRGFASAARAERVILTEGATPDAWADGFAAAIQSAGSGAPLVLSANANLPSETQAFIANANGRIGLVCGPFVEAAACTAASQAMGNE
jgi:putative cell wall-binding protein